MAGKRKRQKQRGEQKVESTDDQKTIEGKKFNKNSDRRTSAKSEILQTKRKGGKSKRRENRWKMPLMSGLKKIESRPSVNEDEISHWGGPRRPPPSSALHLLPWGKSLNPSLADGAVFFFLPVFFACMVRPAFSTHILQIRHANNGDAT